MPWPWSEPPYVLAAPIAESPWPEGKGEICAGSGYPDNPAHPAAWVVWTNVDTGDGMRYTCIGCLAGWITTVGARIWEYDTAAMAEVRALR
jgi:hypothetical protein